MLSTGMDPVGAVRVSFGGAAGPVVRVAPDWRVRLAFPGGDLGAAVVAAWLAAVAGPAGGRASPAVEGDAGEDLRGVAADRLCAAVLDVAGRLSAAVAPRTLFEGERVAVTLIAGVVSGVELDRRWVAGASAEEIGRRVGAALGRVAALGLVGAVGRSGDPVLGEAGRLGADPEGLMRAVA